jgi:hypothetical protein
MKRCFLALAVLLCGAVGMASADYVLIKVNVGQQKESVIPGAGMIGVVPGGSAGPSSGSPPGMRPPGAAAGDGFPSPNPMRGGFPRPMPGGSAGPGGSMGPMGRPFPGGAGVLGESSGPPGTPIEIVTVVEVDKPFKILESVLQQQTVQRFPLVVKTPWGVSKLWNLPGAPELRVLATSEEPNVAKRYAAEYAKVFKDKTKPSADQIQKLAEYALTHDLNDKFVEIMKKLAEDNPTNEAVVAFLKVQAALDRPVAKGGSAELKAHLAEYKEATLNDDKGHFVLFHKLSTNEQDKVQGRLARLEDSLRTYYYWFALKGVVLPVPTERLSALLTEREPEFKRSRDSLSDPPVVGDGIFARRQNLAVFCARPLDSQYDMLDKFTATKMTQFNLNRQELLKGKAIPKTSRPDAAQEIAYGGTLALAEKELEDEAERAGASHEATRQLLFASELLPRNVTIPEWVLFGMGSFFETPERSPWATPAGLSTVYLPAFRAELSDKGKHFEGTPLKTLRKIVTDGYFRELTPDDYKNKTERLMKARSATWSLMYFLAQKKPGNLQRYFNNLREMPRDLELDDAALWGCFARAFDYYDPKTNKLDEVGLTTLAETWQNDMLNV